MISKCLTSAHIRTSSRCGVATCGRHHAIVSHILTSPRDNCLFHKSCWWLKHWSPVGSKDSRDIFQPFGAGYQLMFMHHVTLIQTKQQLYQIIKCFPFGTSGKWFLCCGLNFLSRRWKWASLIALLNNRCTNDKQRVIPGLVIIGSIDFGDRTSKVRVGKT